MHLLKKIKAVIKKITTREKIARKPPRETSPESSATLPQEVKVEKTKFYSPTHHLPKRYPVLEELPAGYGQDKIVLQTRDTSWLHAYWELTHQTLERLSSELKEIFYQAKQTLRVYDVTNIIFDGNNANRYFDIAINDYANNWYIDTAGPGRSWCVDLGLKLPDGSFITIVRSNIVQTPLEGPSGITDEEWMIPDEMFARLYGMGFGLGRSSPVGKAWQERVKRQLFSGALASPSSPVKPILKERKFWLVVDSELIVYGATDPDAKVYIQGKPIKLRTDGTFSLRFALPDGRQVIPVNAQSADGLEQRTITPIVAKETH